MKMFSKPYDLLLVDDQEEIVRLTSDLITKNFGNDTFNIIYTTNSSEALKLLQKIDFHILIADIYMPGIPGDELIRQAIAMNKGTQCIVITADDKFSTVVNAYNDGSVGFISKPVTLDKLKSTLKLCTDRLEFWAKNIDESIQNKKDN